MTRRDVVYRLYRLRRLIIIALIALCGGLYLGVMLSDPPGLMAQPLALLLYSCLSMGTVIALVLRWPRAIHAPLFYGIGSGVLGLLYLWWEPAIEPDVTVQYYIAVTFLGSVVWVLLAPLFGVLVVIPLDLIRFKRMKMTSRMMMPFPPDRVFTAIRFGPDQSGPRVNTSAVAWDGFWEEHVTEIGPDPETGELHSFKMVSKVKLLEETSQSQTALVVMIKGLPQKAKAKPQTAQSYVIRSSVEVARNGSLVTRTTVVDKVNLGGLLVNWLGDFEQDYGTQIRDEIDGSIPRATRLLPMDSMGSAISRLMPADSGKPQY
jgi:hypothetical protein